MKLLLVFVMFMFCAPVHSALQMSHESKQRVTASYWVIGEVVLSPKKKEMQVQMCLYVDEAAMNSGAEHLKCKWQIFGETAFNTISGLIFPGIETRIKNHASKFFENATSP